LTAVPRKGQKEEVSVRRSHLEGSGTGPMTGGRCRGEGGIWATQPRSLGRRRGVRATQEQKMWRAPRQRKKEEGDKNKKAKKKRSNGRKKKTRKNSHNVLGENRSGCLPRRPQSPPFGPKEIPYSVYIEEHCPTIVLYPFCPQNRLGIFGQNLCSTNCTIVLPP